MIASMAIFRVMQFLPAIGTGIEASGINASEKSGQDSPHTQECMQPIEVPKMRRK